MHDWKKLLIALHYLNNRTQQLNSQNYAYFENSVVFSKLISFYNQNIYNQKLNFCLCMIGKSYLLHHIILTIANKNLILKTTRILQILCFFPS